MDYPLFLPADPGMCKRRVFSTDDRGVITWHYQPQSHGLMYHGRHSTLHTYHPGTPEQEAEFLMLAKRLNFRLVGRPERRNMWRAERKRYKLILRNRKAQETK